MTTRFILGAGTPLFGKFDKGFPSIETQRDAVATQYPTESGIELTDNVDVKPWRLNIRGIVNGAGRYGASPKPKEIWNILQALQSSKSRISYTDHKSSYSNLVITKLSEVTDAQSGLGLIVEISLQEIRDATVGVLQGSFNTTERWLIAAEIFRNKNPKTEFEQFGTSKWFPSPTNQAGPVTIGVDIDAPPPLPPGSMMALQREAISMPRKLGIPYLESQEAQRLLDGN